MKKSTPIRLTIKWFWRFTRPDKRLFFTSTTLVVLAMIVNEILPPYIVSRAFDKMADMQASGQPFDFWQFDHYAWIYIGLLLAGLVFWRLQVIIMWLFEIRAAQRTMKYIFDHLQRQSSTFHANRFGGALVSDANKFGAGYERFMDDFTWAVVTGTVSLIGSLIVLATVTWRLALALLIGCLIYLFIMSRRTLKQIKYDRAVAAAESDRTAKLADNITNVATVRAFAGEKIENKLFHKQTEVVKHTYYDLMRVAMKNEAISQMGTMSISITAFVGGLIMVSLFNAPLGALFLAVNYTLTLSRRLWESNRVIRNINRSLGDAHNMTQILELNSEVSDNPDAAPFKATKGEVDFQNVTFRYQDGNSRDVFNDLNFHISAGEKVGLVGPSGGGKTTITKLIMRFMDIQGGMIKIDGHDISKLRLEDLRSSLTSVPQEPMLFHRTIAENISYGRADANMEDIVKVAKLAHAHEFIKDLPNGYETLVGERGVKLSGGQRQRIAIARAMLHQAPILILDEATSALDSESEVLIQDALWKLMEKKTAIVIAHRLSTIQKMDRIIVMDKGKIVEEGSHRQLLNKKGLYARLWSHQSGGFIDE
jgi:ATP-binding cassette, subfamily B, bacterial